MTTHFRAWVTICSLFAVTTQADDSRTATESKVETATFSMYCYWTGEATLGRVDGVVASRIGHWGSQEIVQVDYDPQRTDIAELTATLKKQRSFYSVLVPVTPEGDKRNKAGEREQVARQVERGNVSVQTGKPRFIEPKHSLRSRHPELLALDLSEEQAIALNSWSYFGGRRPNVLTEEQKRRLQGR